VSATADLMAMADLTAAEVQELNLMKEAVYPDGPDNDREWGRREWGVFVRADGSLVSYTGILLRSGSVDDVPVVIGGIGGVATHPAHRGRGYAALGMGIALDFLLSREADFALLVCRDDLVDYYSGLGWHLFNGETVNTQFGRPELFTFNRVMVGDLASPSPTHGTVDLSGPAW
jgi:GNAT superfamily N-acetyltransferase